MIDGGIQPAAINCYSKKTAWAISAKILDTNNQGGYWCIGNIGGSESIKNPISSTACPK
jgi:hypothetical protein